MNKNNKLYSKYVKEDVAKRTPFDIKDDWVMCTRTNGTYLDCPLVNHNSGNVTFLSTVYNPTMEVIYYLKLKVGHDKYKARVWFNG